MDGRRQDLVAPYWRYRQLIDADRAQRLAADDVWWAVEAVREIVQQAPVEDVVDLLEQLLTAPDADVVYVGAGPLEDLLSERPEADDAVAARCRRSPAYASWRRALASVVIDDADRDRLTALAPFPPSTTGP